jgi:ABC-2 type transport system permease protein
VTIISIYREGGILRRLRATPLRPHTILTAHVLVKLAFTLITLVAMLLAGRRFYPVGVHPPFASYALALLVVTVSILTIGFLIASVVPTARFAQPVGALVLYPMVLLSGLFFGIDALPSYLQVAARVVPFTYAVSLLRGIWIGEAWSAHLLDVGALAVVFVVCIAISSRVFRWE